MWDCQRYDIGRVTEKNESADCLVCRKLSGCEVHYLKKLIKEKYECQSKQIEKTKKLQRAIRAIQDLLASLSLE